MNVHFGKVITAMVTPFDDEKQLDLESIPSLVKYLESTGSETLVLAGTTGEGPTLSENEKMSLLKEVLIHKSKETKIIMNIGTNNTSETIENAKKWSVIDGVDAIMVVCPYYNKPSQRGLYAHFEAINNVVNKPIMVYHIPGRTNVTMNVDTMIKVANLSNVKMLKDAEGDLGKLSKVISKTKKEWAVYSGDDPAIYDFLEIGAEGVVSVASHIIGNELKELFSNYDKDDKGSAIRIQNEIKKCSEYLFPPFAPNPIPVKFILSEMNLMNDFVRLPLVELDIEEKEKIKKVLKKVENSF